MGFVADRRRRELARTRELLAVARVNVEKALAVSPGDVPIYVDAWKTQRAPTASELVGQFKGLVYACSFLNAQSVASPAVHVYAQTAPGQRAVRFYRKARVLPKTYERLLLSKAIQPGVEVEELLDHPLCALLENPCPSLSGFALRELTQLDMELTGSAYWRVVSDGAIGVPTQLWILQSQLVTAVRDPVTNQVTAWKYGSGRQAVTLPAEQVVDFHMPNPRNPYGEGYAPALAAWEAVNLVGKDKANQAALLDNRARPDAIVSPKNEEAGMAASQATRLEELFKRKFRQGGAGGIVVSGAPVDVSPITFSPADLEAISRYGINKVEILNQFMVPPALFESNKSRAELEAALTQHSRNCVAPRCRRRDERVSQVLCPKFDDRLFVVTDDPSPEDVERRVLSEESELRTGQAVINEIRARHGQDEVEYGNLPWFGPGMAQPTPAAVADSDVGQDIVVTEAAVLNGAQIVAATAIIAAVAAEQMPRDAGIGQLIVLFNLTPKQAEQMMGAAGTSGFKPPAPPPAAVPFGQAAPGKPAPVPKPGAEDDDEPADAEKDARLALRALRRAGRTLPMDELAETLGLPLSRTTLAVERLQSLGLASRNGVAH